MKFQQQSCNIWIQSAGRPFLPVRKLVKGKPRCIGFHLSGGGDGVLNYTLILTGLSFAEESAMNEYP